MIFLSDLESTAFIIIAITIVIILLVIVFLIFRRKRENQPVNRKEDGSGHPIGSLDYRPTLQPVKETKPLSPPEAADKSPGTALPSVEQVQTNEIELLAGRADIAESLLALSEKYSLDQFTIATEDGLVFASSGSKNAQNDAAIYSSLYSEDPGTAIPGVVLFGLVHKSSGLIGIIRTNRPVSERILENIAADTKDILNWWI